MDGSLHCLVQDSEFFPVLCTFVDNAIVILTYLSKVVVQETTKDISKAFI